MDQEEGAAGGAGHLKAQREAHHLRVPLKTMQAMSVEMRRILRDTDTKAK